MWIRQEKTRGMPSVKWASGSIFILRFDLWNSNNTNVKHFMWLWTIITIAAKSRINARSLTSWNMHNISKTASGDLEEQYLKYFIWVFCIKIKVTSTDMQIQARPGTVNVKNICAKSSLFRHERRYLPHLNVTSWPWGILHPSRDFIMRGTMQYFWRQQKVIR